MTGIHLIVSALAIGSMVIPMACTVQREAKTSLPPGTQTFSEEIQKEYLLKRLLQQEERVRGLKASQVVRILNQRDGRSLDAQGLVAIQKPDRYRIRLYSPLGITLWDFILSPDGFRYRMPSKGIDLSGKRKEVAEKIPHFPVEAFLEAFVHSFEADKIEWQKLDQAHLLTLEREGKEIHTIRRWIDREALTLSKDVYIQDAKEELSIEYQDYRPYAREEGLLLPHRIDIWLPQKWLRLEIRVIRYEINPTFQEEMFSLSP